MSNWIKIEDGLPEDRGVPYKVIGAQVKEDGGLYKGTYRRKFVQDWNVRLWPKNFVAWCYDPVGHFYVNNQLQEQ